MIDEIDKKILRLLQSNSKTSNAVISRSLNMAPSTVFERIKQLEAKKIISGYSAKLNCVQLGCSQIAFLFVRSTDRIGFTTTADKISKIPDVQEVHHVAGEDCYLIKMRVANNQALADLMKNQLGKISSITSTKTTIVLETLKETSEIKII